ncbi:MAG: manganese transporter, partial [Methylocella sp.]
LLLLCNDKAVLGPWVNTRWLNLFTGGVIAVLLMLSIILTASVMFPEATSEKVIFSILGGGGILGVVVAPGVLVAGKKDRRTAIASVDLASRGTWRMPPLSKMPPPRLSIAVKTWMFVLRTYLALAAGLVLIRIVTLVAS